MVHIRSLIGLLFLLNSLKDCSLAHQDDYNKFLLAEDSVVSTAGKEFIDGLKAARKFGFGRGRKMIVEEVERKKESEKGSFNGGRALKKEKEISGKKENNELHNSLPLSQHQHINNDQKHMKKLNWGNGRRERVVISSKEERLLVEATKEMVSLMHKDYSGFKKAKRKPPINNSLPFH
ncbi:uncharacterized protein [Euphorbia lathyris]|uniref:uncharacterized protein isoform X2 n=1 Tax=Euphorbia lathyris TaxID=212925 RepID=UPI0033133CDE